MIFNKVAHNYALALSQVQGLNLEQAEEDLHAVRDMLRTDQKFSVFVQSPSISRDIKKNAFRKALEGKVQKAVLSICMILIERRRMELMPELFVSFRHIVDELLGRTYIDVTVAKTLNTNETPLDEALRDSVIKKIDENRAAFGLPKDKKLNYTMSVKIDPELLAGIRVRVGDYIFDGSVARNLIKWHDVAAVHPLDVAKAFTE
ncbi:MAG TPA: ATP synthase F1 subunit delta [Turneriella sp.]|nr:ATP synthase F1 subunit delta [Turneriella sp.]HMY10603.1 ATP synthase F1 subunit delta [Turneriella sp.]HNA79670.1 ATP synthase F1 subunit delta [Turneriella sp.]HNE19900.1 ATP synthase F1 subunit delta [Turneriella sp.]HNJ65692.1 ATP synthase F1 subunit delta [Turneriella sp.]